MEPAVQLGQKSSDLQSSAEGQICNNVACRPCCVGHTHSLVNIVVWVLAKDHNLDIIKGTCVECPAYSAMLSVCMTAEHEYIQDIGTVPEYV